jgi:hypothetical protein
VAKTISQISAHLSYKEMTRTHARDTTGPSCVSDSYVLLLRVIKQETKLRLCAPATEKYIPSRTRPSSRVVVRVLPQLHLSCVLARRSCCNITYSYMSCARTCCTQTVSSTQSACVSRHRLCITPITPPLSRYVHAPISPIFATSGRRRSDHEPKSSP